MVERQNNEEPGGCEEQHNKKLERGECREQHNNGVERGECEAQYYERVEHGACEGQHTERVEHGECEALPRKSQRIAAVQVKRHLVLGAAFFLSLCIMIVLFRALSSPKRGEEARYHNRLKTPLASVIAELPASYKKSQHEAPPIPPIKKNTSSPLDPLQLEAERSPLEVSLRGVRYGSFKNMRPTDTGRSVLRAGALIRVVLESGINSDLPGVVLARVSQGVRDSLGAIQVPAGTKLIGSYGSDVVFGQSRVLLSFHTIVSPTGKVVEVELPAESRGGAAGLPARVENHYGKLGTAVLLSSLVNAGTALGERKRGRKSALHAGGAAARESVNQAAGKMIHRALSVRPTLMVAEGAPALLITTSKIVLW